MDSLITKTKYAIGHYGLLDTDAPIVLMVSGGGDSIALLHLLAGGFLGKYQHLCVCHVNHGLRGAESDNDESFVQSTCDELKIPFYTLNTDIAQKAADEGLNLEDAGRIVRYEFAQEVLGDLAAEVGACIDTGRICTAHSRDDRIETFFARALYGSGSGALGSIAIQRDNIVRPLLLCDREEIRAWLTEHDFKWREDASNADVSRTRAAIRHAIIPACEQVNPSFRDALERTMNLVADDDAILTGLASSFARDFIDDSLIGSHVTFNANLMATLDKAMARRTMRTAIFEVFPEASRLESSHVEELVKGLNTEGFVRDLPFELRAERKCDTLKIAKKSSQPQCPEVVLEEPGTTSLGELGHLVISEVDPSEITRDANCATVDADALLGTLSAGSARTGERIVPLGMTGSKKVSDVFVDAKVPRELRGSIPIVRDGRNIVWVGGLMVSDVYKITPQTTNAYRIEWVQE